MRYFDEVDVYPMKPDGFPDPDGEPTKMPAHLSWSSAELTSSETSVSLRQKLRMVFPPGYSIAYRQQIGWDGRRWDAMQGEETHTRRGRKHHKSADLTRSTQ